MGKFLSRIGLALTALYGLLLWFIFNGRLTEILMMDPSNIGDLLAGVFGPLAILWLILGFFQQGIELRQNTLALQYQVDELRASVEQQARIAQLTHDQLEYEKNRHSLELAAAKNRAIPKFFIRKMTSLPRESETLCTFVLVNSGGAVHVTSTKGAGAKVRFSLTSGELATSGTITVMMMRPGPGVQQVVATISYRRSDGEQGSLQAIVPTNGQQIVTGGVQLEDSTT